MNKGGSESMGGRFLREIDVRYIFGLYQLGHTQKSIAREFAVSEPTVQGILSRRYWPKVPIEPELLVRPKKEPSTAYSASHRRKTILHGQPSECGGCGTTDKNLRYEWASLTRDYGNPDDYTRLCKPCHQVLDGHPNVRRGEDNARAKLTENDVREIKRRYQRGPGPNSTIGLAKEFGVHQALVWRIVNGKAWQHVQ